MLLKLLALYTAASRSFAFALFKGAARQDADEFKHMVARLVSLLSALMISQLENWDPLTDDAYEILGLASLDVPRNRHVQGQMLRGGAAVTSTFPESVRRHFQGDLDFARTCYGTCDDKHGRF